MHFIDKKLKKEYVLPNDDSVSRGKFFLIIPEGISPNSKPSSAGRNEDSTAHIKEDSIKDEVILEDYGSSNDVSEDETENEKAAEENNAVKEEIFEDEIDNFELENEPKMVPSISNPTNTVTQTVKKSAHFGNRCLKSTLKDNSLYALTRLTKSISVSNKYNQRDEGGNINTLDCTMPVLTSKVSSGKPRVPNYIKVVRPDSYANVVCSTPTTVNCTDIPTTSNVTAHPGINNTNSSSHLPKDNTSSHSSDCDDVEGVFISLKKVPLERRKKTKNKLLRLVKLITVLELEPDEVSFSVTTK